jgi:hypothetical protein
MGLLDDVIAADSALFVDDDVFGESIVYIPFGGAERTINAVVNRNPPEKDFASGNELPQLTIVVRNDATYGISSGELDAKGADRVMVSRRIGQTAESFGVYLPDKGDNMTHDVGMLTLILR